MAGQSASPRSILRLRPFRKFVSLPRVPAQERDDDGVNARAHHGHAILHLSAQVIRRPGSDGPVAVLVRHANDLLMVACHPSTLSAMLVASHLEQAENGRAGTMGTYVEITMSCQYEHVMGVYRD